MLFNIISIHTVGKSMKNPNISVNYKYRNVFLVALLSNQLHRRKRYGHGVKKTKTF